MFCSRNTQVKKFLKVAMNDLEKHQINLKIYRRRADPKYSLDGYFDDASLEIGLVKDRFWLETFVHEYSHFLQWKRGEKTFAAYYKYDYNPIFMVENWLERKIAYSKKVKNSFRIIRANEISCDKIAVELIKKYKLPIDTEKYTKNANLQLLFYHCVENQRNWNVSKIYKNPNLWAMIPKTMRFSYAQRIPSKLMETALECF
jgi:hypothetical protein